MDVSLKRLGIAKLKPKQRKILKYINLRQDVFGLLPTGYGKSVCYIIPHLLTGKNVIVISPLIALMQDQYSNLQALGIPAVCFNSCNPTLYGNLLQEGQLDQIRDGDLQGILYFSPERFIQSKSLVDTLVKRDCLALVAVDEAHCVTTWSDFRSSYNQLSCIRKWLNQTANKRIPLLALSASVPPSMLTCIAKELCLDQPRLVKASFWKNNLSLEFLPKKSFQCDLTNIIDEIRECDGKTLIYCKTQAGTQKIAEGLQSQGISAVYYHGGLDSGKRKYIQNGYKQNPKGVMVATIAFGMGIDIPDIHLIIHYGISRDIESYYQEIGRAGRDKQAASCITFYSPADFCLNRRFANQIESATHRQRQIDACVNLERLVKTRTCRMKLLTDYFGESLDRVCDRCDVCMSTDNPKSEQSPTVLPGTMVTHIILSALHNLGYGCGLRTLAGILTGSKGKRINTKMRSLSEYGRLTKYTQKQVGDWIQQLHYVGYLREHSSGLEGITFLKISPQGCAWYNSFTPRINLANQVLIKRLVPLFRIKAKSVQIKKPTTQCNLTLQGNSEEYLSVLRKWRYQKAKQRSVPPYFILTNKTLELIAQAKPSDKQALLTIKGMGVKKIEQFGEELLTIKITS